MSSTVLRCAAGCVEIVYEIAPARWNRGHATAAARNLLGLAWANGARRVTALWRTGAEAFFTLCRKPWLQQKQDADHV